MSVPFVINEADPSIRKFKSYWDEEILEVILFNVTFYRKIQQFQAQRRFEAYDQAMSLGQHHSTLITVNSESEYTVWSNCWGTT